MDRYLYEETRLNLVRRARNFAVASLSCSIILFSAPYIALGLGFFAILFAFLSKGYRPKMDKEAVTAVKFAIAGICISAGIIFSLTYKLATDTEYRNDVITVMDSFYGTEYEAQYGMKPSDVLNKWFGGDSNE
ncbi:MAG: hypothetical protein IKZ94_10230 [Lachnospiraceae bacterium]|nr:hypothetical protein [Lachnospiraceae bacterium]